MSLIFYNIALLFYALLLRIAAVFNPKAKLFINGRIAIFSKIKTALKLEKRPIIWMHCASLGEFEQGRPLIEKIKQEQNKYCIFLTFFSPSGYEIRKKYPLADYVFYLPLDTKKNATEFLQIVKPKVALFVKYELWFHYLNELKKSNIPVILFSAYFQKNQIFFKWYGKLHRRMLGFFQQIFVQDTNSKELLKTIRINRAEVAGDTRIDRSLNVLEELKDFENISIFKQRKKLIVAGSTWKEDEELLKELIDSNVDNYKLLIVPHEIRKENIQRILDLFASDICLWDTAPDVLESKKVCLVNTMGNLAFLYQYADIAWVGGGFTKSGIHNIIEPAVYGIPVFFGPNYRRFREAKELLEINAVTSLNNAEGFKLALVDKENLIQKGKLAQEFVFHQKGATQIIISYLLEKCFATTL